MKFESYKNKIDIGDILYVIVRAILVSLLGSVLIMMMFGYRFMIVSSGSMTPTLPVGTLIIVKPIDYDDIQVGDILTMQKGGFHLTHRVHGKASGKDVNGNWVIVPPTIEDEITGEMVPNPEYEDAYWITKGDANNNIDQAKVNESEVVGITIWSCEAVGYVYRFVKYNTVYSIVLLFLLMLEIGVASYIKDMVEVVDIEEDDEEDED